MLECLFDKSPAIIVQLQGLDIPVHLLAKVRGNLRLNRLKRLARSLNGPAKFGAAECDVKVDNVASECKSELKKDAVLLLF